MRTLYLVSVWLHILAACAWIGGMLFLALVLVPLLRRPELGAQRGVLLHLTGVRFRTLGWAALAVLVLTGLVNLTARGIDLSMLGSLVFWKSTFGSTLALKLGIVLGILALSLVHDFTVGPRATLLARSAPDSPEAERLRRAASWIGRANLLLALLAAALGVVLVRGWPW
ncbi:MAG: hypothetical protein KatS3mg076_2789 [Candidatus Binatia bacterium]|nr:MAG: hypothetical protein KatS3mg076_2789 [Candidatus Binatia bacterium]